MHRLGALLIFSLCLSSCTDVLGLDGLTYDLEQTRAEATGGAGGTDQVVLPEATDGAGMFVPDKEPYKDTDFPASWPDDSLIVTLPAWLDSNYYWVYQPSERLLYSYELNFVGA